jgi:CRP/FNR family cyclic AMP-dependent transcriptional regulator
MVSVDQLANVALFEDLSSEQLEQIAKLSTEKAVTRGDTLFRESDPARYLYILLEGEISLQVQLTSRNQQVTVGAIDQEMQTFGWSGVIPPHFFTATAQVIRDSRVIEIDGQALLVVLEEDPEVGFYVMQNVARLISNRLRNCRSALLKTIE